MLVVMDLKTDRANIDRVIARIVQLGFTPHEIPGRDRLAIGITGNREKLDRELFLSLPGVVDAIPVSKPYKLVSRDVSGVSSIVRIGDEEIGGGEIALIAGPCSVESREQIIDLAGTLREMGVKFLRGGAYKPRSSPYSFQGLKTEALGYLAEARAVTGMKIVTEVKDTSTLEAVAETADLLQIGARNMQNFSLLEAVGSVRKPVLLKRGISATLEEFLMAAEYIFLGGNRSIILCERGIRTFETATRNTLDLSAVPMIKKFSHLPILVDPSHGVGVWEGVPPMSLAAVAAGADGLIIETHAHPELALSDGYQSLKPARLKDLIAKIALLAPVVGRTFGVAADRKVAAEEAAA